LTASRNGKDAGVSTVLGAILLVGLVFVVFATLRMSFVPHWEEEREAQQMVQTQGQLAAFKSSMDRLLANQTAAAVTTHLGLGGPHTTFLGTFGSHGSVSFTPGAAGPALTADLFNLILQDGQTITTEVFNTTVNTQPVADVQQVESFRLRFTMSTNELHRNRDSVILKVLDQQGVSVGTFVVWLTCENNDACKKDRDLFLNVETADSAGNVLYSQGYSVNDPKNPKDFATYWVDVLDPTYRFAQLLAGVPKPFTIQMTDDGLRSEYAITYLQATSQGTVLVSSGETSGSVLDSGQAGGLLMVASKNQYYPRQDLRLENGALILDQPGSGTVFVIPPDFRVTPFGTSVNIRMSVQSLTGPAANIEGDSNVQLRARVDSVTAFAGTAPQIAFNYTTGSPGLYAKWFTIQMQNAGLQSTDCEAAGNRPQCNYEIFQGPDWVRLVVHGFRNSDADNQSQTPAYDVGLQATLGTIAFELVP
jgi:hypothetical protein